MHGIYKLLPWSVIIACCCRRTAQYAQPVELPQAGQQELQADGSLPAERKEKGKTTPLGVIQEKLMVNPSFPLNLLAVCAAAGALLEGY